MGVTVTREVVRAFSATVKTVFAEAFTEGEIGAWRDIATLVPSNMAVEEYGWLSSLPTLREFVDERSIKALGEYGYTLRNRKFEATIAVEREVIEDEQHGQVRMRVEALAEAAQRHYDQLLFELISQGETALCYDGKAFYANNHSIGGATVSNLVELPLTATNLETVITSMMQVPLDNGEPMMVNPSHLLVGPALAFPARRLLNSLYYPEHETVAGKPGSGAMNPLNGALTLVVSPRLGSSIEWHVLDCTHRIRPFLIQQRIAPEFISLDGSDGETEASFLRDEYLYGVRSRDNSGFGLWQYAFKSTGEE